MAALGAENLEAQEEWQLRVEYRQQLERFDGELHQLVAYRGIVTEQQHLALTNANYAGLYDDATRHRMMVWHMHPYGVEPASRMGSAELGINIFQRTQAALRIRQRNIRGEREILFAAEDVGVEIRATLERMGSPMPEDLPRYTQLVPGEWMPADHPSRIDWDAPAESAGADDSSPDVTFIEIIAPDA